MISKEMKSYRMIKNNLIFKSDFKEPQNLL